MNSSAIGNVTNMEHNIHPYAAAVVAAFSKVNEDADTFAAIMTMSGNPNKASDTDGKEVGDPGCSNARAITKANYMRVKGKSDEVYNDNVNYFNSYIFVRHFSFIASEFEHIFLNVYPMPESIHGSSLHV